MATESDRPASERDPMDARLRNAFSGEPVPALRPGFEARLARRLEEERLGAESALPARDRWLLRGYWILAALASAAVLARVDLSPLPWPVGVAVAVTAAGLAVPILALRRAASL